MNNKKIIVVVVILVISLVLFFALKDKDNTSDNTNNENIDKNIEETKKVHDSISVVTNYLNIANEYGSKNKTKELSRELIYDIDSLSSLEFSRFSESITSGMKEMSFTEPEIINENEVKVSCDVTYDNAIFTYVFDLIKDEDLWKVKLDISRHKTNTFNMKVVAKKKYFEKDTSGIWKDKEDEWKFLKLENKNNSYSVKSYHLLNFSKKKKYLYLKNKYKYYKDNEAEGFSGKWDSDRNTFNIKNENGKMSITMSTIFSNNQNFNLDKLLENDEYIVFGIKQDSHEIEMKWEEDTGYIKDDICAISSYSNDTLDYEKITKKHLYKYQYDVEGNYIKSSIEDLISSSE